MRKEGSRADAAVVLFIYLHCALLFVFRLHKFNFCSFHFAALFLPAVPPCTPCTPCPTTLCSSLVHLVLRQVVRLATTPTIDLFSKPRCERAAAVGERERKKEASRRGRGSHRSRSICRLLLLLALLRRQATTKLQQHQHTHTHTHNSRTHTESARSPHIK